MEAKTEELMRQRQNHIVNVFITVDTEVWPSGRTPSTATIDVDLRRDLYGRVFNGEVGIDYQARVLTRHKLQGVFFVEALFANAVGISHLQEIVERLKSCGQEIQLHLHPEWLRWMANPPVGPHVRGLMRDFSESQQRVLLECGLASLQAAGVDNVRAFRAGDYAANMHTLNALKSVSVKIDSSHNAMYLNRECGLDVRPIPHQPFTVAGICEFPITVIRDRPGNRRHLQLCAVSLREMRQALMVAWKRKWHSVVIVMHSFEMISNRRRRNRRPAVDWTIVRRFEGLCNFLDSNRDKFLTTGFNSIDLSTLPTAQPDQLISTGVLRTMERYGEQCWRRVRQYALR
jgi:hypothetical protein